MNCLINTIGLASINTYACWSSTDYTGDWETVNASTSGLYIDQSEYTPDLSKTKNIGTLLEGIRVTANQEIARKVRTATARLAQLNVDAYEDFIGKPYKSNYAMASVSGQKLGFRFWPGSLNKGVHATIKQGSLKIDTAGAYTVEVWRTYPTLESVGSFVVNTQPGVVSFAEGLDISLPLTHKKRPAQYALFWTRTGSEKPYNVETVCGCAGDPAWHRSGLIKTSGINVDTESEISTLTVSSNKNTYGLNIDVEFSCDALDWVCSVPSSFWTTNHIGTAYAKAIQLWANRLLISKLIDVNGPNAYNLLDRQKLDTDRHKIANIVKGVVDFIALEMSENAAVASRTDCIVCRPEVEMMVQTLDI